MKLTFAWALAFVLLTHNHAQALFAQDNAALPADNCRRLYETTMQHYAALAKFLPTNFVYRDELPTHHFLKLAPSSCDVYGTSEAYQRVLKLHSYKIAVLLPLSRWSQSMQKSLIAQVKTYAQSKGFNAEKNLIWIDTAGRTQTLQEQLAQLVFTQHVSMFIGGLTVTEATVLAQWSDRLRIPAIVLNRKFPITRSRYVFRMGPDIPQMAASLLNYAKAQGYKKVAIMLPESSRDGAFADALTASTAIATMGPYFYNPNDYESIDRIFKKMFHLSDDARNGEMLDLVTEMKEKAKAEGVTFTAKGLMLPPEADFDALVILDHFKNVKHLAKSLHYYGVNKLRLLGFSKWRAPEIVEQEDDNLAGAVFVDYVGSYLNMPYGITAEMVRDENLIVGSEASLVDLKLVVNHGVAAGIAALQSTRGPRFALYKGLEALPSLDKAFFGEGPVFKSNHESNWPVFLFGIGKGRLEAFSNRPHPTKAAKSF